MTNLPLPFQPGLRLHQPIVLLALACATLASSACQAPPQVAPQAPAPAASAANALPPPFSIEDLRLRLNPGRRLDHRITRASGGTTVEATQLTAANDGGVDFTTTILDETGHAVGTRDTHATWPELRDRFAFPEATTQIGEELIAVPAGRFPTRRYTVKDGTKISTYWFAASVPAFPIRTTVERDGVVVERSELFRDVR